MFDNFFLEGKELSKGKEKEYQGSICYNVFGRVSPNLDILLWKKVFSLSQPLSLQKIYKIPHDKQKRKNTAANLKNIFQMV